MHALLDENDGWKRDKPKGDKFNLETKKNENGDFFMRMDLTCDVDIQDFICILNETDMYPKFVTILSVTKTIDTIL